MGFLQNLFGPSEEKNRRKQERLLIEEEHKDIYVTEKTMVRVFGSGLEQKTVSIGFPTSICASCGNEGDFSLKTHSWISFPTAGYKATHSYSIPRCPECDILKVKTPSGSSDCFFENLHPNYIKAIHNANPKVKILFKESKKKGWSFTEPEIS